MSEVANARWTPSNGIGASALTVAVAFAAGSVVGYYLRSKLSEPSDLVLEGDDDDDEYETVSEDEVNEEDEDEEEDDEIPVVKKTAQSKAQEKTHPFMTPQYQNEEHKMVMVARMDLKMGAGKIAAQCCHACLGATRRAEMYYTTFFENWVYRNGQAKIVVKSPTLDEMEVAQAKAQELDIPFYLVRDAGRTQIAAGSATVLAVGPAPASVVDQVTGNFRLY
eukprot:TRINITY_DN4413_c0_g1_i3.p1 TRINITY_DN4413_c0_g1~~TRINITY_DN4413_c0_g1_i3.p1  ORF type:complete len:222 (+),score=68.58 TRINITY_DN4413_c0_g1_i3:44-709(+)